MPANVSGRSWWAWARCSTWVISTTGCISVCCTNPCCWGSVAGCCSACADICCGNGRAKMSIERGGIVAAWLLVGVVVVHAVLGFERTLRDGQLVLLELAPVDPRSLMQGDYMALRFAVDAQLPA